MTDESNSPLPPHAAIKLLGDLLANPAASKKAVADLLTASAKHEAEADRAKSEQQKLTDLRAEVEAGVAEIRTQAADQIRRAEAAHDKRVAEREVAIAAREKRAAELEAAAVAHEAKAREIRAAVEKKQKAWDAA
jgi:hypothetical protein